MKVIAHACVFTVVKTTLALGLLFVTVLGGAYLVAGNTTNLVVLPASSPARTASTTRAASVSVARYTAAQVSTHNTAQDCWAVISGGVYNLTSWVTEHPGGEGPILSICGKDGTSAFLNQHANNARAKDMLATFKIGELGS